MYLTSQIRKCSILAVIFCCVIPLSAAIQFDVFPYVERCIRQDFPHDSLVSGKMSVNPPLPQQGLMARIMDPTKSQIVFENKDVKDTTFAFTSQVDEEYHVCFIDATKDGSAPIVQVRSVVLEWEYHIGEKKDYESVAKTEKLLPLDSELRRIEDTVSNLKNEFEYMKEREAMHRDTNESTNSRVAWLSGVSMFILISLGVVQIYYLKRYFKSKKLI